MNLARPHSHLHVVAGRHPALAALAVLVMLTGVSPSARAQQSSDWKPTVTDDTPAKKSGKKKQSAKGAAPATPAPPTTTAKADTRPRQ